MYDSVVYMHGAELRDRWSKHEMKGLRTTIGMANHPRWTPRTSHIAQSPSAYTIIPVSTIQSALLTCSWCQRHSSLRPLCEPPHCRQVVCACNYFDDKE